MKNSKKKALPEAHEFWSVESEILFVLNNVPDFRAKFLNQLALYAEVVVVGGYCDGVTKFEYTDEPNFKHIKFSKKDFWESRGNHIC